MPNLTRIPRVSWQDQYAVSFQSANLFNASQIVNPTVGTLYGIEEGVYGWDVLGHPDLSNNQTFIDNRKAYGRPVRITGSGAREFQQGSIRAGGNFEWQVSASSIIPWLWAFFQDGSSIAAVTGTAANTQYRFREYTSSDIEVVSNIIRNMGSGSVSHRIAGCVPRSIQFQVGEDDVLKATMENVAYHHAANIDWSTLNSGVSSYSNKNVLLWQDACVQMGTALTGLDTVVLPGIDFTITNNIIAKFYDNQFAQRYVLGDLGITGNITLPWEAHPETASPSTEQSKNVQLTDFQAGTDKLIVISWGGATEDNSLRFELNVRFGTPALESNDNDEIVWSLPFTGAANVNSSPAKQAISIYATEDLTHGTDTRGIGGTHSFYNYTCIA